MNFLEKLQNEMNQDFTWNGSPAYKSTLNINLDLFSRNMRKENQGIVQASFAAALGENEDLAIANFLNQSDIRGGKGERKVTTSMLQVMTENYNFTPEFFDIIVHFNRVDVAIKRAILDKNVEVCNYAKQLLISELNREKELTLLAKWMPMFSKSNHQKNLLTQTFISLTGWSYKGYRHTISALRKELNLVETLICKQEYGKIQYDKIPSRAFNRYKQLFYKYDEVRFKEFLNSVQKGEKKVNSKVLYPYEVIQGYDRNNDMDIFLAQWQNMKHVDLPEGTNVLPVCDFSGSMIGIPMYNSRALGMYLAHHNTGPFKNLLIEFNSYSNFIQLTGDPKKDIRIINKLDAIGSTNIDKVFENILIAMQTTSDKSTCPKYILIISDMQFDMATNGKSTNYEGWKKKFKEAELKLPKIIFWNVSDATNSPVTKNDDNVALIAGFSTHILDNLFNLEKLNPIYLMTKVLSKYSEWVEKIKVLKK